MQTAGFGVHGVLGKRVAKAYGRMLSLFPSIPWRSRKKAAKAYGRTLPLLPSIPWGRGKRELQRLMGGRFPFFPAFPDVASVPSLQAGELTKRPENPELGALRDLKRGHSRQLVTADEPPGS